MIDFCFHKGVIINTHVNVYQVPQGGFEKLMGGILNSTQKLRAIFAWPISESS